MFTGLIEAVGTVRAVAPFGGGRRLTVAAAGLAEMPARGASVAVDGACLTVVETAGEAVTFEAVGETIRRTTLGALRPGDRVNLETALRAGEPLDGHLVQGHVDATGILRAVEQRPESRLWRVGMPAALAPLVAAKGSIAVGGVSLTVVEAGADAFTVSLIPETLAQTTLGALRPGAALNLEADVLARYAARWLACGGAAAGGLSEDAARRVMRAPGRGA
jgi:riboflavin synthase